MENVTMNTQGVLRGKAGATFLGVSYPTFLRWVRQGRIPKGIKLSARCTVWRREALETFLAQLEGNRG